MPPKKKDAKGGGDDDKPPPPPELPELTSHQLEMNERALHAARLQISLDASRTRTTSLERTNAALKAAVADTTRATSDVEEYLTWELAARREIVDELQARIDAKTRECEGETRGMEDRVRSARERADGETRELTARVDALRETEPDISRRRDDKTRILDGLAEVSETVARELHEMKANLHDLESALVRDRERLRAESAARIKATRLALMRLTDEELENTTRRVIARNERLDVELKQSSSDVDSLDAKTIALAAEHERTMRELELQRALVRERGAGRVTCARVRGCTRAGGWAERHRHRVRERGHRVEVVGWGCDGGVEFDFDGAVAETAELERETDALRLGLERHVAAARALARRARRVRGWGDGDRDEKSAPRDGNRDGDGRGGAQGDDVDLVDLVDDWDADGAGRRTRARSRPCTARSGVSSSRRRARTAAAGGRIAGRPRRASQGGGAGCLHAFGFGGGFGFGGEVGGGARGASTSRASPRRRRGGSRRRPPRRLRGGSDSFRKECDYVSSDFVSASGALASIWQRTDDGSSHTRVSHARVESDRSEPRAMVATPRAPRAAADVARDIRAEMASTSSSVDALRAISRPRSRPRATPPRVPPPTHHPTRLSATRGCGILARWSRGFAP